MTQLANYSREWLGGFDTTGFLDSEYLIPDDLLDELITAQEAYGRIVKKILDTCYRPKCDIDAGTPKERG